MHRDDESPGTINQMTDNHNKGDALATGPSRSQVEPTRTTGPNVAYQERTREADHKIDSSNLETSLASETTNPAIDQKIATADATTNASEADRVVGKTTAVKIASSSVAMTLQAGETSTDRRKRETASPLARERPLARARQVTGTSD